MRLHDLAAWVLLSGVLLGACRSPEAAPVELITVAPVASDVPDEPDVPDESLLKPAVLARASRVAGASSTWLTAGHSVQGREIEYSVHGQGDLTVMLLAGIHGDEECGTPLLLRLCAELASGVETELLLGRRLVIVPRVNPDGLHAERRHNANGVDLNRNFPSENFQRMRRYGLEPLSQPESRAIFDLIERYEPDRVLSLHMQADMIDFDGPSEGLAHAVSTASGLRVGRLGANPGSLGSYIGVDLGRQILTIEQPASARELDDRQAWARYAAMIRAAILYPSADS